MVLTSPDSSNVLTTPFTPHVEQRFQKWDSPGQSLKTLTGEGGHKMIYRNPTFFKNIIVFVKRIVTHIFLHLLLINAVYFKFNHVNTNITRELETKP